MLSATPTQRSTPDKPAATLLFPCGESSAHKLSAKKQWGHGSGAVMVKRVGQLKARMEGSG